MPGKIDEEEKELEEGVRGTEGRKKMMWNMFDEGVRGAVGPAKVCKRGSEVKNSWWNGKVLDRDEKGIRRSVMMIEERGVCHFGGDNEE